ncbi:MAG: HAD-IC family P-type ATPase [Rhizobiaceae bacterium]|nr:MAG: HAD-IC family P-type ATPase [Rhizobiaceae bacterium]CAG0948280.1 H+-transporting ATPase [Rhizobiaceae bacterium]
MTPAGLPETTAARPSGVAAGLSSVEAATRLAAIGPNALPDVPGPTIVVLFLKQFLSPLIYLLLAATLVSVFLGDLEDAAFIAVVLLINGVIGTAQEYSASRAAAALRELQAPKAMVVRDGSAVEIDAREIVPGDLVVLEAGARVPADLVLVEAQDLRCDESLLTGESVPVAKHVARSEAPEMPRTCRAFAGTSITRGRGRGIVATTGASTEIGRIATQIGAEAPARPPLILRLERFARLIAVAVGVSVLFLFAVGLLREMTPRDLFLMSVGLAVSAIPEGLPVAISIVLAIGMRRMAGVNVVVRRMAAVETLGSCTMIATDKTGTLTLNELTATEIRLPNGTALSLRPAIGGDGGGVDGPDGEDRRNEAALLLRAAALPNEARLVADGDGWKGIGDTVDVALLAAARRGGIVREEVHAELPEVGRIPYEPDRRYAASFHQAETAVRIFVKGAPETLIAMADRMDRGGAAVAINRAALIAQKDEMAARGLRVLAFAEGEIAGDTSGANTAGGYGHHHLVDLLFLGLVGMEDPVRPEVPAAIASCRAAGIGVVMITGDDPKTACRIAEEAGIAFSPEAVATGEDVARAERDGRDAIDALAARACIYARVEPVQKLAIVQSLTRNGHFVAVTGDGVNDAPALKHAHVGVAMGRKGTDVAKESAAIILTDDNFASIVSGIREGRVAYSNIRKIVFMTASTGAAEVALFLLALPFGLPMPLLPVQLLWLNLVTNGIQDVALAAEKAEGDELAYPPRRPSEPIFDRLMIGRVLSSTLVMGGGGFALFYWLLGAGYTVDAARNMLLLMFVLFENFQTFNSRSERHSVFRQSLAANPLLVFGVIGAQALHIAAMYTPWLSDTLSLAPVSLTEWSLLLLAGSALLVTMEVQKWIGRRRNAAGLANDRVQTPR